jgi:hypothetical protein
MLTRITEIENSQEVRMGDVIIEVERVEEFVLPDTQLTDHDDDDALPSINGSRITNNPRFGRLFQQNRCGRGQPKISFIFRKTN